MSATSEDLLRENLFLKEKVRELEDALNHLLLKVRALEMVQSRQPVKAEDERQLSLAVEHTETVSVEREEQTSVPGPLPSSKSKSKGKKRVKVDAKFENLPVTKETVYIPNEVKKNPDLWKEIGQEETIEIIVEPTKLSRHRIIYKKYRSVIDRSASPIIAKAPIRFSSSYVSSSLAIYIVLSKYLEHSPLCRLEKKFARMGVDITRQCQSDAVERFSLWLRPLYELIDKRARQSNYLQVDETFIQYINGRNPGGGQGYFWAINAPNLAMVFKWIANRQHQNVPTLLEGFSGVLQSDGYAGYKKYADKTPGVTLAACWAHTFRKFRQGLEHEPGKATSMMDLIKKLYELEEQWDSQGVTDQQRKELREKKSIPIAEDIKKELDAHAGNLSIPANDFRKAVGYAAGQWEALMQCLKHGHTRLDTNLLESKFRPTKIGEKNWMFIGHPQAGDKSAIIYTLLACCRIHHIEPQAYFTDLLQKLVPADQRPSDNLLESLLPWNWAKDNPQGIIKELPKA